MPVSFNVYCYFITFKQIAFNHFNFFKVILILYRFIKQVKCSCDDFIKVIVLTKLRYNFDRITLLNIKKK